MTTATLPFAWTQFEAETGRAFPAALRRRVMKFLNDPTEANWLDCRSIVVAPQMSIMGETLWQCTEAVTLTRYPGSEVPDSQSVVRALCYAAGLPYPQGRLTSMSIYAKGETALFTDRVASMSGPVVIDEVMQDEVPQQGGTRYAVHFAGSGQRFVTNASHLQKTGGSTVSGYPNPEHRNADNAARRRALAAADHLAAEVETLSKRITDGTAEGDDTQRIASLARDLTQHVTALGVLRDVREWDKADKAQAAEREAGR
jgi:hypothetical protein